MLFARRWGAPRLHYKIAKDRKSLATWTPPSKGSGGTFAVAGVDYRIEAVSAGTAVLEVVDGPSVAVAEGLGRTPWVVRTHDSTYTVDRTLERWAEQQVFVRGRWVGAVRQAGRSGRHAEAELPDVPDPVAVFVMALVLQMWDAHARSAR